MRKSPQKLSLISPALPDPQLYGATVVLRGAADPLRWTSLVVLGWATEGPWFTLSLRRGEGATGFQLFALDRIEQVTIWPL